MLLGGIFLGLLTACGEKPVETVYHHLESAVELEVPFEEQQEPLQGAEKRENELFEEIVALGLSDMERISSLSKEALSSIDSREEMLEKEKESIEASIDEFKQIEGQQEKIDEELVDQLMELKEKMLERYDSYQQLYDTYKQAIDGDRTLFTMLTKEELTLDELQEQIDLVNECYEQVTKNKEEFNRLTNEYNEEKRDFYESAELNVRYES